MTFASLTEMKVGRWEARFPLGMGEFFILIFPTMYTIIGIISAEEHHKDENAP